jgi:flavin reductase (DIM6/NTAB) family NADH-FMN oxidoreductase RutF/rubredoxin
MTDNSAINFEAFFKVTYGLYIVSSQGDGKKGGYISNTVFQVTAEPVQFAVCCSKKNYTSLLIKESKAFSISVLEKDTSAELIGLFGYKSGRDINKFENVEYITTETGVPVVLDNTLAWFECSVVKTYDVGSHLIFIGTLVQNRLLDTDKEPLTYVYYREVKKGIAPENAPTYIDKSKIEKQLKGKKSTGKYKCEVCGYIYDPEKGDSKGGIPEGTSFEELPEDWVCPVCGTRKSDFTEID